MLFTCIHQPNQTFTGRYKKVVVVHLIFNETDTIFVQNNWQKSTSFIQHQQAVMYTHTCWRLKSVSH